jgi:TolB-like protein
MREVRAALEKAILVADAAPSVAVLPFLNIGGGPDDEYFSDGLSEEIINALSRVPELNVTARTSSFMFPRTQADIRGIGESLGVGAVLEGSVRRAGNRVRVGARLISSNTGVHLWAGKYDRDLSDVFAVQDEIATALAEALRVELAPGHKHVARHRPALPAYEAYLRGRHFLHKGTPAALARTKECFEEAIAFDASYADPHFELGTYYAFMAMAGLRPGRELAPLIRAQAETALRLDASLLSAHALLGFVAATHDYDWAEAERQFRLATAAERVSPEARYWYALLYLVPLGHGLAAVRQMEVAVEHDPLNVFLRTGLAGACNLARRFDRTLQELRKVLEIDDAHWMPNFGEGAVYVATGRYEDAVRAFERGHQVAGRNAQIIGHLAGTLAVLGNRDRAAGLIGQLLEGPSHLAPIGMAAYHAICHEVDEAAAWFEKAIEFRDPVAVIYTRHPPCDAMRRSGKWPTLARMMNLPAENEERQRQSRAGE